MTISIITVVYNGEKTLARTIESVLNQSVPPMEYWIMDGASADRSAEIAASYEERFKELGVRYHVISKRDDGLYDAMNKGIALSTGDVVGIINSDDWYEPAALQRVTEVYEKEPFDLFYADLRIVKRSGNFIKRSRRDDRFISSRNWNHPTTFISQNVYRRYSYNCAEFYADFDLILRLRRAGIVPVILNEVLANFTFGGVSNEKKVGKMLYRARERYRMYRRNGYGSPLYFGECYIMEIVKFILA